MTKGRHSKLKSMLQPDKPLWLPEGSIRALLSAFLVVAYAMGWVDIEVVTLVLGFYFVGRANAK